MPAVEPLDLRRGREHARIADGAVALQTLAQAGVYRLSQRDARVASHAVKKILIKDK